MGFVATGDGALGSTGAIQLSKDGGQSWQMLPLPVEPNSPIWAFATHRADPDRILATVKALGPDIVHLARADAIDDATLQRIRAKVEPAQLLLTVPVDGPGALDTARRLSEVGDSLLLDTKHPDTGVVGATGHTHDWSISADIVNSLDITVVLAGGLGPENVRDAIAAVRPFGVDSETRTSQDEDRRRKDIAKVEEFISLARAH